MTTEWILALLVSILIITGAVVIIELVLNNYRMLKKEQFRQEKMWHLEMWNITHGFRVEIMFQHTVVVGRMILYGNATYTHGISMDTAISREHLLLYEQDDVLWAWNLSAINPASINGYRLNTPQQLRAGNRLEIGNSTFLITRVSPVIDFPGGVN